MLAVPLCEDTGPVLAPEGAQVAEMVRETREGLNQEAGPFFAPENWQIKPCQVSSSPRAALRLSHEGGLPEMRGLSPCHCSSGPSELPVHSSSSVSF